MANARVQAHIRPYGTVTENARRIVRARLAELYVWAQYTHDPSRAREQHQLRIAAKRLRYTLELFRDFLPEQTGDCIKALKNLQDALGLLHDCDVLIAIVRSAIFVPDGHTSLVEAIPEAQDLPPALLEVLGQRAQDNDALASAAEQHPEKQKKGKRARDAKGKRHRHAARQRKAGKQKSKALQIDEARSRVRPNKQQAAALEHFLMEKTRERADLYQACVKRWENMEERDFRATVLHLVEEAETPGHFQAHPFAPQNSLKSAQQL